MIDKDSFKLVIAEAANFFRACFIAKYKSKDEAQKDVEQRLGSEAKIILFLEMIPPHHMYMEESPAYYQQESDSPEIIEGDRAIKALLELDGFRQAFQFILGELCGLLPH